MGVITIDNSVLESSSTDDPASPRKITGFALPGYASRAARKGHELGPPHCYQWTRAEAREYAARGGRISAQRRREALGSARLLRKGEALP